MTTLKYQTFFLTPQVMVLFFLSTPSTHPPSSSSSSILLLRPPRACLSHTRFASHGRSPRSSPALGALSCPGGLGAQNSYKTSVFCPLDTPSGWCKSSILLALQAAGRIEGRLLRHFVVDAMGQKRELPVDKAAWECSTDEFRFPLHLTGWSQD